MNIWYRRLAEVPGANYAGSLAVNRSQLPFVNCVPELAYGSLRWPSADGISRSPAASHRCDTQDTPGEVVKATQEALELPGEPRDYHFRVLGCIENLWRRRREDFSLLDQIEWFCWVDVQLVEAVPRVLKFGDGDHDWARAPAFGHLVRLREQEGFVREALEVVERGQRLGQHFAGLERLQTRMAELEAEDDG